MKEDTKKYTSTLQTIDEALQRAFMLDESKESAMCITKLEEAYLWLDKKHVELQVEKVEELVSSEALDELDKPEHTFVIGDNVSSLVDVKINENLKISKNTVGKIISTPAIGLFIVDFGHAAAQMLGKELQFEDIPF